MILIYFRSYSAGLALPLVSGIIYYVANSAAYGVLGAEIITLIITFIFAIISWRCTCISKSDDKIIAQNGFFLSQNLKVELDRASCITIRRGFFDFLLSSAALHVKFNTETPQISDFKIILYKKDANEFFSELEGGIKLTGYVYFAAKKIYCQADKIGIIKMSRTPIDRLRGKCKVRINVRNKTSDRVRIRNLDFEETAKKIDKYI